MSKVVCVYRKDFGENITVETRDLSAHSPVQHIAVHLQNGSSVIALHQKYFGAYTLDGAYRFSYTAYVASSIDQGDITQEIADTIFMMAKKQKIAV